ncbi:hypothetical protein ACFXAZ_16040 [Streptomyces sp. NPDC059477]|uniref:hypothetical protein n=1 Tax=Streptomyces sp. NPDC059477 TaxID=3346847 RepID=UPI0036A8F1E7
MTSRTSRTAGTSRTTRSSKATKATQATKVSTTATRASVRKRTATRSATAAKGTSPAARTSPTKSTRATKRATTARGTSVPRTVGATGTGAEATYHAVVRALLDRRPRTYPAGAGIRLRNTPAPLYQTLVLAVLLSARIRASAAVSAARELFAAGLRDARSMADASWQDRVDALGRGGYRRYDESTANLLGRGAELLLERYGGDLRRLRAEGDPKRALLDVPGIGPTGADIFLRDVQGIWPEWAPYFDRKALEGARRLGLPVSVRRLSRLVPDREWPGLADALVHVALEKPLGDEVLSAVRGV